ncbi:MAG: hypothetical protein HWE27_04425 [Gammaproteobacteria bacterium]|nr:hypothetical protein [Gammaproteobacteria bacterium]
MEILLRCFPIILACFLSSSLQAKEQISIGHPILGTWVYQNEACTETYTYSRDGIRHVTAADEIVRAKFQIEKFDGKPNVYLVRDEVIFDNGKPDCQGDSSVMVGSVVDLYIVMDDRPKRISFCLDMALKECFGPFNKK